MFQASREAALISSCEIQITLGKIKRCPGYLDRIKIILTDSSLPFLHGSPFYQFLIDLLFGVTEGPAHPSKLPSVLGPENGQYIPSSGGGFGSRAMGLFPDLPTACYVAAQCHPYRPVLCSTLISRVFCPSGNCPHLFYLNSSCQSCAVSPVEWLL